MPDELDQVIKHIKSSARHKPSRRFSSDALSSLEKRARIRRELKKQFNIHKPRCRQTQQTLKTMNELKKELASAWPLVEDVLDECTRLSPKQIAFAKHFALNGRSKKTQSARDAGYESDNSIVLLEMANRNLDKPEIMKLIEAFEHQQKARMKMTVDDVVAYFTKIADSAMGIEDFTNANRAMENLAKYLQMFVTKTEITHRTISSPAELDARIAELTAVLESSRDEIDERLTIN